MVPFGLTQDQFAQRYRRELDRRSSATIDNLRVLHSMEVPSEVRAAQVEIFMGEDGAAPAVWIYFSGRNNRVDNKDQSIFAGRSMNLELKLDALANFSDEYFTGGFPGNDVAANVLKSWFAECWWKAGGWNYCIPTAVHVHDDYGDGEHIQLTERAA